MMVITKLLRFLAILALVLVPFYGFSNVEEPAHADADEPKDIKTEIKEFIAHHLLDAHDFVFTQSKQEDGSVKYYGFPLPVMLYDDLGFHFFMSSAFEHGDKIVESKGGYYKLYHSKIYRTDASGTIEYNEKHFPKNEKPLDLSITKNVVTMILTGLIMFLIFSSLARSYRKNNGMPSGIGRFFEPLVVFVRDEIAIPNIGKNYKKYMSFLLTVFFFIWILNLLGLTPLGVNVTGNIAVTACLAIIVYLITTFTANWNYWKHIFWMPGVPVPMKIILAPIELLGTFIKPFSLMIRLYANMAAGHVVLMSIIGLMFIFQSWIGSPLSFLLAFALMILKIFVAALQAYIFTMLAALYFGAGNEEHHHDEEHAH
jgi:F-type H+-transporting ATPase subunit a